MLLALMRCCYCCCLQVAHRVVHAVAQCRGADVPSLSPTASLTFQA